MTFSRTVICRELCSFFGLSFENRRTSHDQKSEKKQEDQGSSAARRIDPYVEDHAGTAGNEILNALIHGGANGTKEDADHQKPKLPFSIPEQEKRRFRTKQSKFRKMCHLTQVFIQETERLTLYVKQAAKQGGGGLP